MKNVIALLLFSIAISGCATQEPSSITTKSEPALEGKAKGVATHYYIASDIDPSESGTLDKHHLYQSFKDGCPLDFYKVMTTTTENSRWQLREESLQSSHLGTYRRFLSDSTFQQGKYDIPKPLKDDLTWFAQELTSSPVMPFLLVIGHTNSDGSASYNQALSENRAEAVHEFLIAQNVPSNRIQKFGVGETTPLQKLDAVQSTRLNRRVELITFIPTVSRQNPSRCTPESQQASAGMIEGAQQ